MTTNFWHKNVKCYGLKQVMWQTDFEFIYVLNKFWTISETCKNMYFIDKICFKTPPMDNILPYLFYTNVKTIKHNKNIFEKKMVKYSHHEHKTFILTHVLFILDYQSYQTKQLDCILNY